RNHLSTQWQRAVCIRAARLACSHVVSGFPPPLRSSCTELRRAGSRTVTVRLKADTTYVVNCTYETSALDCRRVRGPCCRDRTHPFRHANNRRARTAPSTAVCRRPAVEQAAASQVDDGTGFRSGRRFARPHLDRP